MVVTFQLCFFFQLLSTITVTSYTPVEHFAVNCGSPDNVLFNYRNWTGDNSSTLFSLIDLDKVSQSIELDARVRSKPSNPYDSARLSNSEFSYSFPVTDGQKFIRLYFYPSFYNPDFLRSDAFFTVKAGNHTLLKDFNASLNADAGTSLKVAEPPETIVREYCVNVDPDERLNITFMPNRSYPNAYAFVSGIEVVSMPSFLYYTNPHNVSEMMLDGGTQQLPVMNSSALETVYRTDVGGSPISADKDSMFRYWEPDNDYLDSGERKHSISAGYRLKPIYTSDQNYFAPDGVYMTARNYGMNETSEFNVTWEFEVDLGFFYMVRLHFCEFDEHIEKGGDRMFKIFINDAVVEAAADVMLWTKNQRLVPVHKDYAASMLGDGTSKSLNLSIKLQPQPIARTTYRDVLLNGIEILKISNNDTLAGPNPELPSPRPSVPSSNASNNVKKAKIISVIVGATSGFIVMSLIILLMFRRLIRGPVKEGSSWRGRKSEDSSMKDKFRRTTLPSNLCRYFSIEEIKAATNNFDDIFIVGVGGFGNVYKGYIDDNTVPVAIKRLKQGSKQGLLEFQTEIEMLSQLRHRHLVSLIGYCNDGNEMILVYEFMARGTLRDHIYDCESEPLSWKQRLKMCLGAAHGLHYLHTDANHQIIHRDVKTTNILIDENWVAKVSDFGLSKVGPTGMSKSHISTVVKGSLGYLDPEYYKRQRLTEKSDVYSFGVVLLEVLCGRPPLKRNVEKQKSSIVDWVRKCHRDGVIHQTVDPLLIESITPECLKAYSDMALKCLVEDGNERPSMSDVVWGLEFALQLQEGTEDVKVDVFEIEGKSEERDLLRKETNNIVEESKVGFTSSDESKDSQLATSSSEDQSLVSSGVIFSELGHPTVR